MLTACAATPARSEAPPVERGEPVDFAFGTIDGAAVTSETTRDRVTVLLFVTTYDLPSQAAARRLAEVVRTHAPRFNAAAVVIEAPENAVLAEVFRSSLGLPYPVALADSVELRASPQFATIDRVPIVVVLDREGRLVLQRFGLFESTELAAWLAEAER